MDDVDLDGVFDDIEDDLSEEELPEEELQKDGLPEDDLPDDDLWTREDEEDIAILSTPPPRRTHSLPVYDDDDENVDADTSLPASFFELTPTALPSSPATISRSTSLPAAVHSPVHLHQSRLPLADAPHDRLFYEQHFDRHAGLTFCYPHAPDSHPVRTYQLSIARACLFQNTLVALPTGLGKTFIAAVVIHAYFRWYPHGKLIFMAPTRPLVAQQIDACASLMQLTDEAVEMTGAQCVPLLRAQLWRQKRLFFCTPQILQNDLQSGLCPAEAIRLLVIDEAHRALGQHAYCQVVRQTLERNPYFRVMALTATPGSDKKTANAVVSALLIAHIEMRTEQSDDVRAYLFEKDVKLIPVAPTQPMLDARQQFMQFWMPAITRLRTAKILFEPHPDKLHRGLLLRARDQLQQQLQQQQQLRAAVALGDIALLMSLSHALQLLDCHGLRSFLQFLKGMREEGGDPSVLAGKQKKPPSKAKRELFHNPAFHHYLSRLESLLSVAIEPEDNHHHYIVSHPKYWLLQDTILQHFREHDKHNHTLDSRVIVFAQYRETVTEVCVWLSRHARLRVVAFIGQSQQGLCQRDQLAVLDKFKRGHYNVLVSTSIGEEGLDIADVDLIVCFDAQASATRTLQRMGRTGRHRQGDIVFFLAQGKEEDTYVKSQQSYRTVQRSVIETHCLYTSNKRMIPADITPKVQYIELQNKKKKNEIENNDDKRDRVVFIPGKKGEMFLTTAEITEYQMRYQCAIAPRRALISETAASLSSIYRVGHARRTAHWIALLKSIQRHKSRREMA